MSSLKDRFLAKIRRLPNGCLVWTGAKFENGYGYMTINKKMVRVTHVSWFLKYGVWPKHQMNHTCDAPLCVKPAHLYDGTQKQNMDDMLARGRANRTPPPYRPPSRYDVGGVLMTIDEIAARAGVTRTCICLRMARGITGRNLLARSHQGPRR